MTNFPNFKFHIIHSEALPNLYNDMLKLTEDLVSVHRIRQQNFNEIQKSLENINSMLKSASKLRGTFQIDKLQ